MSRLTSANSSHARYGDLRDEYEIIPTSGKAMPVKKGEVFRSVQHDPAGMCVDINIFNLHDYVEHVETSISRRQGFHIPLGGFAISDSPRNSLMMQVIEKPETCVIDMLGHRCSPAMNEAVWGEPDMTNCQDSLAGGIGEYGLTPDDTHASYTLWMPTGWDEAGLLTLRRNVGVKPGDCCDFLALMDVLMVACTCGINDLSPLGNYFQAPVSIGVFEASDETNAMVADVERRFPPLEGQKKPEDFPVKHHIEDRALRKVDGYKPQFNRFPMTYEEVEFELTGTDLEEAERLVRAGLRTDLEDAVRSGVIEWYNGNRANHHPLYGSIGGAAAYL